MNTHHVEMSPTVLERWEGTERCPVDRIGIGHLVVEESGIESKGARGFNSMNIYHIGTCLTPLCSLEGAEHCPGNRNGIGHLGVKESRFECWDC